MIIYYILLKIHCIKSVQIRSFFWSVFSHIRTEYGDLLCKSPYSVLMRENTDQKKNPYLDTFYTVKYWSMWKTEEFQQM